MRQLKRKLQTVLKNKIVLFLFSRYATYFIHFVNSLFIAIYLGPYYLGIWGFISLVLQYINQINFGINHSVTAIISVHKKKELYTQKIIGTSFSMLLILSGLVGFLFFLNGVLELQLGVKYDFSKYSIIVVLIGILGYFNNLFSSLFRVYSRLFEIAFNQTIFPVLVLFSILFFKKQDLLWAMVISNLLAFLLSFILYVVRSPFPVRPIFVFRLFKFIQTKGWYLFVYNTSFYLIIISTRSFVSAYYSIEEFGYFTFAFSLANVILMLLQAFSYLIHPKLLNRFAYSTNLQNIELLEKLRDAYVTTSHILVYIAIVLFPLIMVIFPQYKQSIEAFVLISLSLVLYTNSFGYSGLLIAKGFEKKLSRLSLLALCINVILAFILITIVKVPFTVVIIATMISYFVYVFLLGLLGRKMLHLDISFISVINDIYPLRLLVPFMLSNGILLFSLPHAYLAISLVLFVALNYRSLLGLRTFAKTMIQNPNFINI